MCACSGSVPVAKALGSGSSTIQMRGRGTPADRKSTRLNSSHLVISYAVFFVQKNTRLNSSHLVISYAVFCLKKKKHPRHRVPSVAAEIWTLNQTPAPWWYCAAANTGTAHVRH